MIAKHPNLLTGGILAGASALLAWALVAPAPTLAPPPPPPPKPTVSVAPKPSQHPKVDVVFVLDTTGSMSSLIEGAKRKIWEIARYIGQGQPSPALRIGLIAYRDLGDEYVTKTFELTEDLDLVYQRLSSFTAAGGGDTPEHVAKALHEAVYRTSWSQERNSLRLVYLVGDAPPHQDYNDGFNYHAIAQAAGERGIRINTVRCGQDRETEVAWTEIAQRSKGDFMTIEQSGGVVDVSTPFDDELAGLNRRLVGTTLSYGTAEQRRTAEEQAAKAVAAPVQVQAERAGWFGLLRSKGRSAAMASGDLLEDVAKNKVNLGSVPTAELPPELQGKSVAAAGAILNQRQQEREALLSQIREVTQKRDAHLRSSPAPQADSGFDGKVRSTLKKQGAEMGLAF